MKDRVTVLTSEFSNCFAKKQHLRKCSTSFVIRKMQMKTTLRLHATLRMAKINKTIDSSC